MAYRRTVFTTVSIWGEGSRDWGFVSYLYKIYHVASRRVKPENAHGGDPTTQIDKMIKYYLTRDFDERYAVYDLDRGEKSVNDARRRAKSNRIIVIESDPCVEVELLKIMGISNKELSKIKTVHDAKKRFMKEAKTKTIDGPVDWEKVLPREKIDEVISEGTSSWLKKIVKAIIG